MRSFLRDLEHLKALVLFECLSNLLLGQAGVIAFHGGRSGLSWHVELHLGNTVQLRNRLTDDSRTTDGSCGPRHLDFILDRFRSRAVMSRSHREKRETEQPNYHVDWFFFHGCLLVESRRDAQSPEGNHAVTSLDHSNRSTGSAPLFHTNNKDSSIRKRTLSSGPVAGHRRLDSGLGWQNVRP